MIFMSIQPVKNQLWVKNSGLQAAQMADQLIPAVMNKVMESLSKANANLVQMRDPKTLIQLI